MPNREGNREGTGKHFQASRHLLILLACLWLTACATTSLLQPYPLQADTYRRAIAQGTIADALPKLARKNQGRDRLLYLMEQGRLQQLDQAFDTSRQSFAAVIEQFNQQDMNALVDLSNLGAQGASLLTNDNALPYRGDPYERILSQSYQALNYLALGDPDGAEVEIRRLNNEQKQLEDTYHKALARLESNSDIQQARAELANENYQRYLKGTGQLAARARNSFQNAWSYYLSGVFWEARGDANAAYIDYRKAATILPADLLETAAARAARQSGITPDNRYRRSARLNPPSRNHGKLVVLYEEGLVIPKTEVAIPLALANGAFVTIAFPVYEPGQVSPPQSLQVVSPQGQSLLQTQILTDVNALAARALKDKTPALLARQILRAKAKYEMQKQAADHHGALGQFLANLYTLVTERADLRSWLTLPSTLQAGESWLPAGTHTLQLESAGTASRIDVPIKAGHTTLVHVARPGNHLLVYYRVL